ncbi:hypothetical protein FRB97_000908 [Tulasnella sp. 331]|nr:hypothetical protein FRB97_000908 [Tulasnella sp. 331]
MAAFMKQIVSYGLNQFIAPYVDNFDSDKLSGGLYSGVVKMKDLRIKKGALDNLRLPIDVLEGQLGELTIRVPYTALRSKPVEVVIEDLYLLVVPVAGGHVDLEEDQRRALEAKLQRLANAEMLQTRGAAEVADDAQNQGFVQALLGTILNNLQITIKNIHIRYEDNMSVPGHPFAVGITLAEFTARTTDGQWQPSFVPAGAGAIFKLAKLESLALYFNTDEKSISGLGTKEFLARFKSLIADRERSPDHQYLLKPVTGEARIIMNKKVDKDTPHVDVEVHFENLGFILDDDQYRDTISMIDMYHFYVRQAQYKRQRPSEQAMAANPRRAMLKFAGEVILKEVHDKNRKWTWDYIRERRDDRHRYVTLFKRKLDGPPLNQTETTNLQSLESRLSYEDLRFYRSIARSELKKDRAARKRLEEQRAKENATANAGSWFGWARSIVAIQPVESTATSELDTGMTAEQRKELYEAIDYDEKASTLSLEPSDALKLRVASSLQKGSFSLRTHPHENSGEGQEVISVMFDAFRAQVLQRPENMEAMMTLGDFGVFDGTSPGSLHHQIVRVKKEGLIETGESHSDLLAWSIGTETAGAQTKESAPDALFYVKFEHNPPDQRADSAVTVRMKALEIIYHKGYVEAIAAFLRPPESQLESVGALINAASQTLGELRKQSRAGLEYALQTHKTIDVILDLKSPIIIIPENVQTKACPHMVLDAGHISIKSDLVPKSELYDIHAKKERQYTDEDFAKLNALMYDKFFLKLESAQLVIGGDLDSCMAALNSEHHGRELHLLERINMDFSVQMSIVPDAYSLARFKVSGKLPSLNVNFSNMKYKALMRFIDISIPNFGGATSKAVEAPRPAQPDPVTIPSMFKKAQEEYTVDDDDDRSTLAGSHEDDRETFVDADAGHHEQAEAIHQHMFEFAFEVQQLRASLFKSTSNAPEKPLATVVLERFSLKFDMAKYNMNVDVALGSLSMHMIDNPAHPVPLVMSSRSQEQDSNTKNELDLVHVKYVRAQKESPEFMSVYEGIDQSIDATLSTLILRAAPEPILNLYDFIMYTFVAGHGDTGNVTPVADRSPDTFHDEQPLPRGETGADTGKIRVRVDLKTVELVFINAEQRIATLALSAANVAILLRANSMRVGARLGNLSLTDDSGLATIEPSFKEIISIEGDELADFTYETFDSNDKEAPPGVNSLVHLQTASLKVNFLEQPLHDIYYFLVKFGRMKSLYDAATQAAVQRAATVTRMKFDVTVKSPIIIFPRNPSNSMDVLVMKLGQITASNEYSGSVQTISAGLKGIRLTSHFRYGDEAAKLKIIEDVEISSGIVQTSDIDRKVELQRPDTAIQVGMSDVKVSLTESQYIFLIELSQAIPRVLGTASDAEEAAVDSLASAPAKDASRSTPDLERDASVDLSPELGTTAHVASGQDLPRWNTVDLVFTVKALRVQLYDKRATLESTIRDSGIVRLSISENVVRFKMLSDGSTQTEVVLKSFTINNTRAGNSKFREIIPAAQHDRNQFMVLYTTAGGSNGSASAIVSIDSPKIIFAIDPVFALLELLSSPFNKVTPPEGTQHENGEIVASKGPDTSGQPAMSMRLDLQEVSISILEKDDDPNTQAIQLSIKEVLMSQQGILALTVNRMGMFLMSMNKPSEKVSFLDEVDITLSLDNRQASSRAMTSIEIAVLPIVFRASMRDINLIMAIVNRGMELSSQSQAPNQKGNDPFSRPSNINRNARSRRSIDRKSNRGSGGPNARLITSKEKLQASFDGFRLVLIGDIHELPMLHLETQAFSVTAKDWSSEVRRDALTGALAATIASQDRLDVNVTTAFVEFAIATANIYSRESERVLKTARGGDAPYRVINRTGTLLQIWSDSDGKITSVPTQTVKLADTEETDWRFDDWKTMREGNASSRSNTLALQFQGKSWEPVRNIPVDREGEFVYALRPRTQKVADRLLCEVTVKDNVKIVTLRSTYKIENLTLYPVDVILVDARGKPSYALQKLAPGGNYCIPIDAILQNDLQVRPDPGFGYGWPERPMKWQDFMRSPAQTIACPYKESGSEVPFQFQAWGMYDANDPTNRQITVRLRPPIEFENLLPYDVRYTIYDRDSRKKWTSYLRRGGLMPIHCVHLDQFVLFNVEIQEIGYKPSEFAIINNGDSPDFNIESILRVADQQDRKLDLGINYVKYEDSGGAFKVQLYSPFVAINKTGFPFNIRTGGGKAIAGQVGNDALSETTPFMFSHPKEQGGEFSIRIGDSTWSSVLNFEAPTAEAALILRSTQATASKEAHIGVSWSAGLGKYKITKVVSLVPRFVVKNELSQNISVRESGDPRSDAPLKSGQTMPIHSFSPSRDPGLTFKYPGVESDWSSPINIQDIGVTHARLSTGQQSKPDLARLEVSVEGATIWVVIKQETNSWPFLIENASDYILSFSQTDERRSRSPTVYTLQPHTSTPYAWDAPAARNKKLELKLEEGRREVDIMEIGDLIPFKFRTSSGSRVVSLDVRAEGPKQVLTVTNYSEDTSLYRRRARSSSTAESTISREDTLSSQVEAFEAITEEIKPSMSINLDFEGIGISLINRRLVEVVYLTLSKLKVEYTDSEVAQAVNIACGWIQLDNQLHEAIFPIVLQPMAVQKESNSLAILPSIQASVIVLKDQSHGVLFIKYASILLQALSIQMDEDFLFALLDLTKVKGIVWEDEQADALTEFPTEIAPPSGRHDGQDLYFEVLELQPMRLALSFTRTERVNADEKLTLRNPFAVALNAFTMTIGNINDAPLRFNALAIKDMRLTVSILQDRIMYHYKQEVLRQLYRILGSVDFIGNPVGLFNNVSSGVADIFYEPYKGVVMHGSKELGIGIAKGAASFAKKTVFGVTDSMTKVTSSIGKGLSAATFDAEYQRQRRQTQRKNRPGNAIYGVTAGAEAFATSLTSGIEGVVMKPLEGAEREGALGFFKGVGKGLVGAITKPAVGVFDLASNFTEGIRNTTTVFDNNTRNRKRVPRHIPADGILAPYSQREAVGQSWMKDLDNGKYRSELYVAHLALPEGDTVVMLTTHRIMAFSSNRLRMNWDLPFPHIEKISIVGTGISFAEKAGRNYDQFIRVPDAPSRSWFFGEIEKWVP